MFNKLHCFKIDVRENEVIRLVATKQHSGCGREEYVNDDFAVDIDAT